jgi:hypothetical protein
MKEQFIDHKFTRGFSRSDDSSFIAPSDFKPEREIVAIEEYAKKKRSTRRRTKMPLLPGVA